MAEQNISNQGVSTRVAAAQVLAQVFDRKQNLDEVLEGAFAKSRLPDADRKLVHAICGFVFRNLTNIDSALRLIMDRKRDPSPRLLHQLLRVGVAQLLYMEVAPHAAVHATVSATGSLHLSKQKKLVNAVLRSVQRQKEALLAAPARKLDQLPQWLRGSWIQSYGESFAATLAEDMGQEAPVDISVKDAHALDEWGRKLGGEILCQGSIRVHQGVGQIASWSGFAEGAWWVQDAAASLPIKMLGNVAEKSVLDICAAPGGKTLQLAAAGAQVTALDVSAVRLQRLGENIARVGVAHRVKTVCGDAHHWCADERFDVIVLDAPCSSTGTLRRHPELPWIHDKNGVLKNAASQRDLLRRAAKMLREGGVILYCTCSLEVEEGENQVVSFLEEDKTFKEIVDIPAALQPVLKRGLNNVGWRTFPGLLADKGGMDGFFIARLQKQ